MNARITNAYKYSLISYRRRHVNKKIIIRSEKNEIYIAFRGSCNVWDFKDAVNSAPMKTSHGLVHTGFYKLYESAHGDIIDVLKKCSAMNADSINVVGHSRGGSIALIGSTIIKNEFPDSSVSCVILGAPMTCDKDYMENSKNIVDNMHFIEVDKDIVPKLFLNPVFSPMKELTDVVTLHSSKNVTDILGNHSCYTYLKLWRDQKCQKSITQ
jgi:hypothetical protein